MEMIGKGRVIGLDIDIRDVEVPRIAVARGAVARIRLRHQARDPLVELGGVERSQRGLGVARGLEQQFGGAI